MWGVSFVIYLRTPWYHFLTLFANGSLCSNWYFISSHILIGCLSFTCGKLLFLTLASFSFVGLFLTERSSLKEALNPFSCFFQPCITQNPVAHLLTNFSSWSRAANGGSFAPREQLAMSETFLSQLRAGGMCSGWSPPLPPRHRVIQLHASAVPAEAEALLSGQILPPSVKQKNYQELRANLVISLPLPSAVCKCCWLNYPGIPQDVLLPPWSLPAQCCLQEWHCYSAAASLARWHNPSADTLPWAEWPGLQRAPSPPGRSALPIPLQ